jgi:hypothetical protein
MTKKLKNPKDVSLAELIEKREKVRKELNAVKVNGTPMTIINDLTTKLNTLNAEVREMEKAAKSGETIRLI